MIRLAAILHTPPGAGGIAVIVLTGPAERVRGILERISPRAISTAEQGLSLRELCDERGRLDEAVITLRDGETPGAAVAEINIHGGPRVTQRVLQRLAELGAQVEASPFVGDANIWPLEAPGLKNPAVGRELIEHLPKARTRFALEWLTRQWSVGLSDLVSRAAANPAEASLAGELRRAAERLAAMQRLLDPAEVVLAGPPNAGKSSLANALLGRPACIVTSTPGTTRDWVRELADFAGCPAYLTDTAGLWETDNPLDAAAVQRAWRCVESADVVLAVFDCTTPPSDATWHRLAERPNAVVVANKIDLMAGGADGLAISAETGQGLDELRCYVRRRLGVPEVDAHLPAAFTPRQARLAIAIAEAIEGENLASMRRHAKDFLAGNPS